MDEPLWWDVQCTTKPCFKLLLLTVDHLHGISSYRSIILWNGFSILRKLNCPINIMEEVHRVCSYLSLTLNSLSNISRTHRGMGMQLRSILVLKRLKNKSQMWGIAWSQGSWGRAKRRGEGEEPREEEEGMACDPWVWENGKVARQAYNFALHKLLDAWETSTLNSANIQR